jgi:hypothetical protein
LENINVINKAGQNSTLDLCIAQNDDAHTLVTKDYVDDKSEGTVGTQTFTFQNDI